MRSQGPIAAATPSDIAQAATIVSCTPSKLGNADGTGPGPNIGATSGPNVVCHSAIPVIATIAQGVHSASLLAASTHGSVSAAHSANSCHASAPVW